MKILVRGEKLNEETDLKTTDEIRFIFPDKEDYIGYIIRNTEGVFIDFKNNGHYNDIIFNRLGIKNRNTFVSEITKSEISMCGIWPYVSDLAGLKKVLLALQDYEKELNLLEIPENIKFI